MKKLCALAAVYVFYTFGAHAQSAEPAAGTLTHSTKNSSPVFARLDSGPAVTVPQTRDIVTRTSGTFREDSPGRAFRDRTARRTSIDPSQIDIVRDAYGVPHIFANTDPEVAYGLAWAHAEDDFATIQKCFLASKSMLGLQTGRDGAVVDYVVHLLQLRELVDSLYEKDISEPFKNVLLGYCDGFNAYAEAHPRDVLLKKSFPITPQDVLVYSILQLAIGCGVEDALKEIFDGSIPLAEWNIEGSNAFAFNSNITADGNTFLAINTHHPMEGQVAWYEAHVSSAEGWNMLGSLFPGSPVIFTGVNENLGWTHTVNHPDRLDVYQLEMHPENELQYRVDDQWYTLKESVVKLKVKVPGFNLHVKRKTYWSIHGPAVITDKGVFAIRTGALMDIRGLEQWYWMNKAENFTSFRSALAMQAHPSYNIVYADRFDTIYYISNGRIPVREPGFEWNKTVPGNTAATLWSEFYPIGKLPQVLNPRSGYVFNVNHSPFRATADADNLKQEDFDPNMGYETHDNNRSLRVVELLQDLDRVSYADFRRIKYDLQLPQKLAYPVNIDTVFLLDEQEFPEIAEIISGLKQWDRKATIDSRGAALFGVFFYYVAEQYKRDNRLKFLDKAACVEALAYVKHYMVKHFGKTDVPLGQYQRIERNGRSLPLPGLPDVLAAMYSTQSENGRVRGTIGECYISLVRFTDKGPEIETINAYGASNRPESPHYADQMKMFSQQKTKKMTLDKNEVYRTAKTVYHPEVFARLLRSERLTRGRK